MSKPANPQKNRSVKTALWKSVKTWMRLSGSGGIHTSGFP